MRIPVKGLRGVTSAISVIFIITATATAATTSAAAASTAAAVDYNLHDLFVMPADESLYAHRLPPRRHVSRSHQGTQLDEFPAVET